VERTWAERGARLHLLALDWAKAFDSIDPAALLDALRRFGLPLELRQAVAAIYTDRAFIVRDSGCTSTARQQMSGICQGCPLSPFLFIIVMTVIMFDATAKLGVPAAEAYRQGTLYDILYADDTLLLGTSADNVSELAAMVERIGADYGMKLHWGKTQALAIGTDDGISAPGGGKLQAATSLQYLGAVINRDRRLDSEVSRKVGIAKSDFRELSKVWNHANVPVKEKLEFFHALIMSRLEYGLSSVWLVTAQRRRLDGFYARCLRRILRIQPSFLSRISNASVFATAGVQPFTEQLRQRQLILLGKVARSSADGPLRRDTFIPGPNLPLIGSTVRRVGRPRQDWTTELLKTCDNKLGRPQLQQLLSDGKRWKTWCKQNCGESQVVGR